MIRLAKKENMQNVENSDISLLPFEKTEGGFLNRKKNVYPTISAAQKRIPMREMHAREEEGAPCGSMVLNHIKKIAYPILCILLALVLSACGGKVKEANTHEVSSELYSEEDIRAAIDTIKKEFERGWDGCTLTEIYYAGDESSKAHQDWADRNEADEVIVLLSSFDVDSSGGNGSLNPNSTYENWNWILVRTNGGAWKHVDHGY